MAVLDVRLLLEDEDGEIVDEIRRIARTKIDVGEYLTHHGATYRVEKIVHEEDNRTLDPSLRTPCLYARRVVDDKRPRPQRKKPQKPARKG